MQFSHHDHDRRARRRAVKSDLVRARHESRSSTRRSRSCRTAASRSSSISAIRSSTQRRRCSRAIARGPDDASGRRAATGEVDLIGVRLQHRPRRRRAADADVGTAGSADRRVGRGRPARSPGRTICAISRRTIGSNHLAPPSASRSRIDRRGSHAPSMTRSRSSTPRAATWRSIRVAGRVGITRRHLERQFREYVGLGAKHLARIARVHAVLDLLQQQPAMSGAEIAADAATAIRRT